MKSWLLAALLSVASAAGLAEQTPHVTAGGDPRTLPEERWVLADTTDSGALRHITPKGYVDLRGYRFLWMRISRPQSRRSSSSPGWSSTAGGRCKRAFAT